MHHKSEAFEKFRQFKSETEKQLGKTIKAFQSDWGGEYLSREFLDFFHKQWDSNPAYTTRNAST